MRLKLKFSTLMMNKQKERGLFMSHRWSLKPLIALMKDQVDALQEAGVAATFLNSTLDAAEARRRLAGLESSVDSHFQSRAEFLAGVDGEGGNTHGV